MNKKVDGTREKSYNGEVERKKFEQKIIGEKGL